MKGRPNRFSLKKTILVVSGIFCFAIGVNAQQTGDFSAAYAYSVDSPARAAAPTPSAMAGAASFGVFLPANFLVAASTQTFTATKTSGSNRSWGYGVTKVEANRDFTLWKSKDFDGRELHFAPDYTVTLPTDGNEPAGVEHYAHQFLWMLEYTHSAQNYFEIDAGDLLGARNAGLGYKQTVFLSLIGQHTFRHEGNSGTKFDFELDASPSSEGTPSSAVLTAGPEHSFNSKITFTALALVGLTANDPAIGVALRIKFTGSLAKKPSPTEALTFSKLQRLERVRFFGKIGRF